VKRISTNLFLFAIVLFAFEKVDAQQIKPKFKKLAYVPYYIGLSGKDTVIVIRDYLEINEKGLAHYTVIYGSHVPSARDTTYQLPDTSIAKLNKVFDGNSNLESYRIANKLPNGMVYGGQLKFISFTDYNNVTHCFIDVKPYMSRYFNTMLDEIIHRASNVINKDISLQDKARTNQIIECQSACKYCAKIVDPSTLPPPTVKELMLAPRPSNQQH
jgi:hypothetical protein